MRHPLFKLFALLLITISLISGTLAPANALVRLDSDAINLAIRYGLKNQHLGLSTILGPNWIEGDEGSLLNIYTPFMLVATQASKKKSLPEDPTPEQVKQCRRKIARIINKLTDPKEPQMVKFSLFLYGHDIDFARRTRAKIIGVGRGQEVVLQPARKILDEIADESPNNVGMFEGINAYYFKYDDIEPLEKYRLVITRPDGTEFEYSIHNDRIY